MNGKTVRLLKAFAAASNAPYKVIRANWLKSPTDKRMLARSKMEKFMAVYGKDTSDEPVADKLKRYVETYGGDDGNA